MDFTDEQEDRIVDFQASIVNTVIATAVDVDKAEIVADDPEFYGPLCEMFAEYCANHGVDLKYPVRVSGYGTDGMCEDIIYDCTEPTDMKEREFWDERIDAILEVKGKKK